MRGVRSPENAVGQVTAFSAHLFGRYLLRRDRLFLDTDSNRYRDWETDRKSTRLNSSH